MVFQLQVLFILWINLKIKTQILIKIRFNHLKKYEYMKPIIMNPKTPDGDRIKKRLFIYVTAKDKNLLLDSCKKEGYQSLSSFCRAKLFKKREIKIIEAGKEFISLVSKTDAELNKNALALNDLAKAINSHAVYQIASADRDVINQEMQLLKNCFCVLQKYVDVIDEAWLGRF